MVVFFRNLDLIKMDVYLLVIGVGDVDVIISVFYLMLKENLFFSFIEYLGMVEEFNVKNVMKFGIMNIIYLVFSIKVLYFVSVIVFVDGFGLLVFYFVILFDIVGIEYRMMLVCDLFKRDLCVCIIVILVENMFVILLNDNYGNVFVVMFVDKVDYRIDWLFF